VKLYPVIDWNS